MKIWFKVVTKPSGNPKEIVVSEEFKRYTGLYEVRELSAKEGIDALNRVIAENPELQENPDQLPVELYRKSLIEQATLKDGKPIGKIDLKKFPNKVWQLLIAANERLNGVSDTEARFLLEPSWNNEKQRIQP